MSGEEIRMEASTVIAACLERYGVNVDSTEREEIIAGSADTIRRIEGVNN